VICDSWDRLYIYIYIYIGIKRHVCRVEDVFTIINKSHLLMWVFVCVFTQCSLQILYSAFAPELEVLSWTLAFERHCTRKGMITTTRDRFNHRCPMGLYVIIYNTIQHNTPLLHHIYIYIYTYIYLLVLLYFSYIYILINCTQKNWDKPLKRFSTLRLCTTCSPTLGGSEYNLFKLIVR